MKRIRLFSVLIAALLAAALLSGCSTDKPLPSLTAVDTPAPSLTTADTPAPSPEGISVIDMAGREVKLAKPAERVVVLAAADCEILYEIGAGDKLAGRGEYCNYPEEAVEATSVQSGSTTNIEQIVALMPQVVIMPKMSQTKEHAEALENAGITVVATDAQTIAGVYEVVALIGEVTGKSVKAAGVVSDMKAAFAEISEKAQNSGKTVYFEASPLQYGLWTAGSGTFMDEIAAMLGLKNAFWDVAGWAEVSQEQVIERKPDYIVTTSMYFGEGEKPEDEIMGREGWENIPAVQNGAVFNADTDEITRPGPRLAKAAKALYEFIYETAEKNTAA